MNRCLPLPRPRRALLALGVALSLAHAAVAQPITDNLQRRFPDTARRGVLKLTNPPEVLLDGKPDRLSPGSRIRSAQNLIVMPAQLIGQEVRVNYTRETTGQVHDIWILTPEEQAQQRPGNNDYVQRNYRFASEQ